MKKAWFLHIKYFLFWILYFVGAKMLFLVYQGAQTKQLTSSETLKVFWYGLRLDASFTGYLCVLPFCFFLLQSVFPRVNFYRVVTIYSWVFIGLLSVLTVVDLQLYQAWGFRLDTTPFQYISTPTEMAASAGSSPLLLLFFLFIGLTFAGLYGYYRLFLPHTVMLKRNLYFILLNLWFLLFLIVPIRGGWQQIPINHSDVYFSDKLYANQAALNVPWNILYSLSIKSYQNKNPYVYLPDSIAQKTVGQLHKPVSLTNIPVILKHERPNILFIILESFTAKVVGSLGGEPGITPNLDRLAREGILFDSIYASGDRSEKGLVAILSSYPVQPGKSIIKTPHKTERLPHLNKVLATAGYHSSFYYGGELAFANIKSYLINARYDRLISKFDFDPKTYNSKWGVHDHVLLKRVLQDLKKEKQPFLTTVFTLSSHEPYEIPIAGKFKETDEASLFKNAAYYTDYALGQFFKQAKKEPWWQNTLVVLVADHGHRFPGDDAVYAPSKFRIPFILTGGALTQHHKRISKIGSQTDIVPTLLAQMNLPTKQFAWSKNLLNPAAPGFAFYVFNDGFGYVTTQGILIMDNIAKKVIRQDSALTPAQINQGKAYMQTSFQDFLRK